ncbi:hypothetical protein V2J09_005544 [Rumex salicifolius]
MVKIVEEEEDEEEVSNSITPSSFPTPSSSSHQRHRLSPPESNPSSPPPASHDSPSSLSSDQTFHGFSPKPSPPHNYTPEHQLAPIPAVVSRLIRDEPAAPVTMTESGPVSGFAVESGNPGSGENEKGGGRGRMGKASASLSALRGSKRDAMLRRAALGLRVFELVACLISFSVMAADKNRGWALDSFDQYKEFRYSMSVNVIGFAYSSLQGYSLAYQLSTGKQFFWGHYRCYFDFLMDQATSSSAATRVDDWILNWGIDKFPAMASASVGMSFLAFMAFALSSLISGSILCTFTY